jgi:hypothetical protein
VLNLGSRLALHPRSFIRRLRELSTSDLLAQSKAKDPKNISQRGARENQDSISSIAASLRH